MEESNEMKNKYHCARHNHHHRWIHLIHSLLYLFFFLFDVFSIEFSRWYVVVVEIQIYSHNGKKKILKWKGECRQEIGSTTPFNVIPSMQSVSQSFITRTFHMNTTQQSIICERHTTHPTPTTTTTAAAKKLRNHFREISLHFSTNCFSYDIISSDHECWMQDPSTQSECTGRVLGRDFAELVVPMEIIGANSQRYLFSFPFLHY